MIRRGRIERFRRFDGKEKPQSKKRSRYANEFNEYRWETGIEKTWKIEKPKCEEEKDEKVHQAVYDNMRRKLANRIFTKKLKVVKYLSILVDCSEAMKLEDLKPSRIICTSNLLTIFIKEFFFHNPLGLIEIIALRNESATRLSSLNSMRYEHILCAESLKNVNCNGSPSIQNGIDMAVQSLEQYKKQASLEILAIMGSFGSCDPGDFQGTFKRLLKNKIHMSVITLSAEVFFFRLLTKETNGLFGTALDANHFSYLLLEKLYPFPKPPESRSQLIRVGFCSKDFTDSLIKKCSYHIVHNHEECQQTDFKYNCPQCKSTFCSLPIVCNVCELKLGFAYHITQSLHHLRPVTPFREVPFNSQTTVCFGCQKAITVDNDPSLYQCPLCFQYFCGDCDLFIHETLHTCAGCCATPKYASDSYGNYSMEINQSFVCSLVPFSDL